MTKEQISQWLAKRAKLTALEQLQAGAGSATTPPDYLEAHLAQMYLLGEMA